MMCLLRCLTLGCMGLVCCTYDGRQPLHTGSGSSDDLSVIISNQCSVVKSPDGYFALFINKDSSTIYDGVYTSKTCSFDWKRPVADGIIEGEGQINVLNTRLLLRSVSEFESEVIPLEPTKEQWGIALGKPGWGVGDIQVEGLVFKTKQD